MSATRFRCKRRSISQAATSSRSNAPASAGESGTASGGSRVFTEGDIMIRRLSCFALLLIAIDALGQSYPAKPIRLVVPFPAGESVDATARLVGQSWSAALGQQILVDNRGGAGGTIGSEAVARSAPDGYTLLWGNVGPLAIGPSLYQKLGYDVAKDFEPVSLVATLPFVLFASPLLPANSVVELLAYARAHPGEINFGSTGVGSGLHLIGELFKSEASLQIVHVPYKGIAQALPEMMSGKVQIAFNTIPAFLPHVKSGRLKALVITSTLRSPLVRDSDPPPGKRRSFPLPQAGEGEGGRDSCISFSNPSTCASKIAPSQAKASPR